MEGIFRFPAKLVDNTPENPSVEICFSFDTTGSMSHYIDEVKKMVEKVTRQLTGDLPDIRISIIAHGDYCDSKKYVLKRLDLSNDVSPICDFITGVEGTYGGDADECYELVLREAQNLEWSPSSAKALVVIGDASPHKPNEYFKINWETEVEKLRVMGVRIYGVRCGTSKAAFYDEIANRTGGATLEISKFQEITEIIMGLCYTEAAEMNARERRMREVGESSSSSPKAGHADDMEVDGEAASTSATAAPAEPVLELPASVDDMTESDAMKVHFAIHSGQTEIEVQGHSYAINTGKAGCRLVHVGHHTFVEQNKNLRGSKYAQMARDGRKITWIIRKGKWGLIMGERQEEVSELIAKREGGVTVAAH